MREGADTIELRDLVGPYTGQVRVYLKHAGENALASGFAERVEDSGPELEVRVPPAGRLPEGFPGRVELEAAGFTSVTDVPDDMAALKAVPGIGAATARKIIAAVRGA